MSEEIDMEKVIEQSVSQAASTSVEGMSVSQRRVDELIAADKYLSRKRGNKLSFGMTRMKSPEHF